MRRHFSYALFLLCCGGASATTYNFYFNTNEQGDGGTITNTQAADGRGSKAGIQSGVTSNPGSASEPTSLGPSMGTASPIEKSRKNKWSMSLGASMMAASVYAYDSGWYGTEDSPSFFNEYSYAEDVGYLGGRVGVAYSPLSYLSLGVGVSLMVGPSNSPGLFEAEVEAVPLKLALFGQEDALEAFGLIGGNFLMHYDSLGVYAGFGGRLNFAKQWSIDVTVRQTFLNSGDSTDPLTVTAGLGLAFL